MYGVSRRGGPTGRPRLSPRERDVVGGVARSLSNREIGAELGICEQTVKNVLTSVFRKMGVRSRVQVAIHAVEEGLAAPDS
jgi:two-component system nitrate/nitrite response regulator NarL